ncbi:MAG TPA: 23S rRNA (adenine(2503)-C(2))-methyltransferase RlmN [Bacteroidales bacterium]|nr:23S rRNA (adenine(2503)-C(2))-methyltransferase RlmN [Bacteroidales bacterium]
MEKISLCSLTADEIFHLIGPSGYTMAHAVSITNSVYKKNACEISQIIKIPKKLKAELSIDTCIGIFKPVKSEVSIDKTVKYLFRTETGKEFESVFIPENRRGTVCVSTQSGCRMGCSFCATASYGYHGNLSAGEIVSQIISLPEYGDVTHVVFMGMGEPMDNFENVLKACEIITAEWGLSISPRNVTVSSVGITPGIEKFLENSSCNLTISLQSPFIEERKMIVPAEKLYPVHQIIEILKKYPIRKKRRLSIAYVMIKDLNDSDAHLEGLKALIKGSEIRVNLIPYHQIKNDKHISSSIERMQDFKHNLVVSGISASIRKSRGSDISAACGLLATGLI